MLVRDLSVARIASCSYPHFLHYIRRMPSGRDVRYGVLLNVIADP